MKPQIKIVLITGPTASGKTKLAVSVAKEFSGEIISVDSRQVYHGLDIGSGKDLKEYGTVNYHLIDIIDPAETYNLKRFRTDAVSAISEIANRKKIPILSGGTPLYIDSLLSEYTLPGQGPDDTLRERLKDLSTKKLAAMVGDELPSDEAQNRNRLIRIIERKINSVPSATSFPFHPQWLIIGVLRPRAEIHQRIEQRLKERLEEGLIEEVEQLHKRGLSWEKIEFFGLEYKYVAFYLQKKISRENMIFTLTAKIRQFARRQDVWFRKLERKGFQIYWIHGGDPAEAKKLISNFLTDNKLPPPTIRLSDILNNDLSSVKFKK